MGIASHVSQTRFVGMVKALEAIMAQLPNDSNREQTTSMSTTSTHFVSGVHVNANVSQVHTRIHSAV